MSTDQWKTLISAKSYQEAAVIAKSQYNVCQYRRSDLKQRTKYSFKCSNYRKYPSCSFEIQIIVPDDDQESVTVMSKNAHEHREEEKNPTTRLPSPLRESVSKYIQCGLSEPQITAALQRDHPQSSPARSQLKNLVNYERRKDRPSIFSVYDLRQWCEQHQHGDLLHSTYIPFYTVTDIDNVFVFFTTKQLFQQIRCTSYLQVDATYKITWNDLPLLVFGSTDGNRHFKPFGIALVSSDESSKCYEQLFTSINTLSMKEFNHSCVINQVMADGAAGMLRILSYVDPINVYRSSHRYHECSREGLSTKSSSHVLESYDSQMPSSQKSRYETTMAKHRRWHSFSSTLVQWRSIPARRIVTHPEVESRSIVEEILWLLRWSVACEVTVLVRNDSALLSECTCFAPLGMKGRFSRNHRLTMAVNQWMRL